MKWLVVAAVLAATLGFAANGHAQETPPFLGDADCNDVVASIDAAITLQYGATLSSSVPCPASADASMDQSIDAVDASLMLQMSAGLIAGIVHETIAVEPAEACDAEQTSCTFATSEEFEVSVLLHSLPLGGNYVALQTQVLTDGMMYRATQDIADEIVWPDATFLLRNPRTPGVAPVTPGEINHGAVTAPVPPFPDSSFTGPLVTLTLVCPEEPGTHIIALGSYTPPGINSLGSGVLGFPASGQSMDARMIYHSQVVGRLNGRPVSQTLTIDCV